jgi:hypothetical protein
MRVSIPLLFVAMTAISGGVLLSACGGDDTNPAGGTDSGSDSPIVIGGDGGPPGDGGGGDAGCNFATFVTGLITNHTNGTDKPSTDLGQGCIDNQNQAEFKPLF